MLPMDPASRSQTKRGRWLAAVSLAVALGSSWGCERSALPQVAAASGPNADCPAPAASETPALGADERKIGSLRVRVDTGTPNGAGTDNAVLLWIDNRRARVSPEGPRTLEPGQSEAIELHGSAIPETLGELRDASIVLTLDLGRAEIGASWYCERASLEVRFAGSEDYEPYLEESGIGWLSQDEPPRRSTVYALQ